ncbi:MAG TPA: TonB-dependent receptor [Terracidiphilus sp.]|nr:TonB-dependent receptor [Terracidiphilus sp.]
MNSTLRTALVLAFIACASLLFVAPAGAQSVYGSIFGTVTDTSGAAIPNATITVTDESKGTVVTAVSNASGDYAVPHLIPDVYDLKATARGFKVFEAKGISVQADTAPRIDPTLQVGAENTTVEVNAESQPELKTDRADVSTVFDQQQVSSLPVGDQNFTNLQLLLPGAQLLGWSHAADENPQGSKQIQVDGQAFGGTAFELDGTDNQDPILGIIVINPAMDAVTETKITTQNFDAELGKAVSAVVTAQTRSGTNSFHGSAYDFRTGNANLARDPFSQPPDSYTKANGQLPSIPAGLKNRFGGSIGGPVLKNKFFFFGNYEAQRQKVGTAATATLPTSNLTESALGNIVGGGFDGNNKVAGADFGEYEKQFGSNGIIYDTTKPDASGNPTPFPDNVVPTSYLSSQALAILKLLEPYAKTVNYVAGTSSAQTANMDQNYHGSGTGLFNSNQWTERVDYTINDKMHAFERFSRFWDTLSGKTLFGADMGGAGFGIGGYGGTSTGANDSLASGMDVAISPKLITDFRLGYYRYNVIDAKADQNVAFDNTLGIPGINLGDYATSGTSGFFILPVPGGTLFPQYGQSLNINRCNCPLTEREDQFQIVNNWTKVEGNHTIKLGVDLRYARNLRVPSDTNRTGDINFGSGPTSNQSLATPGGLGFATFLLGDVSNAPGTPAETGTFGRYIGNTGETNAKEFQKRTFFYGQDTWRVSPKLTLNLGLRWELYFPETVNAAGNGALLNMSDGYLHVAGVGGVPTDMGWNIQLHKMFDPRVGATYQLNPKTVLRAGYGRSFDIGVFGSIFGHTVTQNLPVLANQEVSAATPYATAFTLAQGPPANQFPKVPSSGLLPNPGSEVTTKSRPNPLNFPTIDAWNVSVERAITSTMSLTVAYVGNKGTHTLGDGDNRNTNPNEAAINLPAAYSVNGQALHYDHSVAANVIASNGGTSTTNFLQRYYGGSLAACKDTNYTTPTEPFVTSGMCGWTQAIFNQGDDQNTHFNALQVNLQQTMSKGLAYTANYQWAKAWDYGNGDNFYTWDKAVLYGQDSAVRDQQLTLYGSYDLPFGKGKQFVPDANRATDLLIGGFQLSTVLNWSGGLPFTLNYNEASTNIPGDAPSYPSYAGSGRMKTSLTKYVANGTGTGSRSFYTAQTTNLLTDSGTGIFKNPGVDTIGNVGFDTYKGPGFFNTDLALSKAFTLYESLVFKFRMDAFNAFNHINPGNPGGNIESAGTISGEGAGGAPRQLEFSMRVQF